MQWMYVTVQVDPYNMEVYQEKLYRDVGSDMSYFC